MFELEHTLALQKMLDEAYGDPTLEIEARLGRIMPPTPTGGYHPGGVVQPFESNIGDHALTLIRKRLRSFQGWTQVDRTTSTDTFFPESVRTTTYQDGTTYTIRKDRLRSYDIPLPGYPFDVRISVSREVAVDPSTWPAQGYRTKDRESFRHKDTFLFEATEVSDHHNRKAYEFELELFRPQKYLEAKGSRHVAESMLCKVEDVVRFFDLPPM